MDVTLSPSLPTGAPAAAIRLRLLDWLLVLIIVVPVFGTFFPLNTYLAAGDGSAVSESRSVTIVLSIILAIILGLFAAGLPNSLLSLRRNWLILSLVFWAMVTASWAEVPFYSFNRSGRLLIFALYGIYLADMMEPRRALRILFIALTISLSLSLLTIIAFPSLAGTNDPRGLSGTWRGALNQKNGLGILSSVAFVLAILSWLQRDLPRKACVYLIFLSAILLVLANSVTAMFAVLLMGMMIFFLFVFLRIVKDRALAIVLATIFATVLILCLVSLGPMLELIGRDSTLTGRSQVWQYANWMIAQRPFWGWGHAAWSMPDFFKITLTTLGWSAPHAHNFWLDLRLQLGMPGLVIGIAVWAWAGMNSVYLLLRRNVSDFAVPFAILMLVTVRSYSETIVVEPATGDMFSVALATAWVGRLVADDRRMRASHSEQKRRDAREAQAWRRDVSDHMGRRHS